MEKKRHGKPPRDVLNISFSRDVSTYEVAEILIPYEIIRSKESGRKEIFMPTWMIHDIKYRLNFYDNLQDDGSDYTDIDQQEIKDIKLSTIGLAEVVLQYELLRARDGDRREVSLPINLANDISNRLKYFENRYGEVERLERDK